MSLLTNWYNITLEPFLECDCDVNGAVDGECIPSDLDGCQCKEGYTGRYCDKCLPGYFGFPNCQRE